jgi:hypothetical protein
VPKSLLFAFAVTFFSNTPMSAFAQTSPKLFIQPATIFDSVCQQNTGFQVEPSMQSELAEKIGNFQNQWDKRAGRLISESEQAAGRKFTRKEYSVALTLCKWTPMGDPAFIVSARPYLGPERVDGTAKLPGSITMFVSMTHHELLHSLVDNILNQEFASSSSLLEKYKSENFNVLVHLHLMAIQKAVNEKIGDPDLIQSTDKLYALIGGDYKRTWDIVNAEGTERFLAELQAYNSRKK